MFVLCNFVQRMFISVKKDNLMKKGVEGVGMDWGT